MKALAVTFERLPGKHNRACQYDVLLGGMKVGMLYREYSPGWIAVRNAVGGSAPGAWEWVFDLEEGFDTWLACQHWRLKPRWYGRQEWRRQADARRDLVEQLPADGAWVYLRAIRAFEALSESLLAWREVA